MGHVRNFDISALNGVTNQHLQIVWNSSKLFENRVWQFTIFLPRWFVTGEGKEEIFTAQDGDLLQGLLERDFGGCTWGPSLRGIGHRGSELETNIHRQVIILASRWRGTKRYFRALRQELEECTGEERVLMLREDLVIT